MTVAYFTANLVRAKNFPSLDAFLGPRPTPVRDRSAQIAEARAAGVWKD